MGTRKSHHNWHSTIRPNGRSGAIKIRMANSFGRVLRIEPLEDRRLLSITVDTLIDLNANDGLTTLREAIIAAAPGDTINFAPSLTSAGPATINLSNQGRLFINKNLTINGPGAKLLTINAFDPTPTTNNGDGDRVFSIDDGTANVSTVSINGLTITGGDVVGSGGGIRNAENLTLSSCVVSGNVATSSGGGLYNDGATSVMALSGVTVSNNIAGSGGGILNSSGNLTVTGSTISANSVNVNGGGIKNNFGTLSVTSSTISGNNGGGGGGGILSYFDTSTTVTASTISGNSATSGGGIWDRSSHVLVISSTISGNLSPVNGGGFYHRDGSLTIRHSTIAANRADTDADSQGAGGGMFIASGTATLDHALVAGNIRGASTRSDISGGVSAQFSLVGDNTGTTLVAAPVGAPDINGNLVGTGASPIDPLLGLLADNGGPTKTHALLVGSPAVDAGNAAAAAGVGSVPLNDQRNAPFTRVFDGDGAGGARIDIGAYERQTVAGLSLVVDTLVDENDGNFSPGDLSLREALNWAAGGVGAETVTFATALTAGGPATILLTKGELAIPDSLTINGPGANLLAIDASGNDPTPTTNNGDGSRVFNIDDGDNGTQLGVSISGLTLTGGDVGTSGGAISSRENLSIIATTIVGNFAAAPTFNVAGGGILNVSGRLNVVDSTISGNSSFKGGGIQSIGANAQLIVTRSIISGNFAVDDGGGIQTLSSNSVLTVVDSTISGNSTGSGGNGGGIYASFGATVSITGSTISGNTSGSGAAFMVVAAI